MRKDDRRGRDKNDGKVSFVNKNFRLLRSAWNGGKYRNAFYSRTSASHGEAPPSFIETIRGLKLFRNTRPGVFFNVAASGRERAAARRADTQGRSLEQRVRKFRNYERRC